MAAADVLDEHVPAGDYLCTAELFEPAHRSQSGLQPSVIGFDPSSGDLGVGLVDEPAITGRMSTRSCCVDQQRREALHPPEDRDVISARTVGQGDDASTQPA